MGGGKKTIIDEAKVRAPLIDEPAAFCIHCNLINQGVLLPPPPSLHTHTKHLSILNQA